MKKDMPVSGGINPWSWPRQINCQEEFGSLSDELPIEMDADNY